MEKNEGIEILSSIVYLYIIVTFTYIFIKSGSTIAQDNEIALNTKLSLEIPFFTLCHQTSPTLSGYDQSLLKMPS